MEIEELTREEIKTVFDVLYKISPNKDFIYGIFSELKTKNEFDFLLQKIEDKIVQTEDEIVLLTLLMEKEREKNDGSDTYLGYFKVVR